MKSFEEFQSACKFRHSAYDIDKQAFDACDLPDAVPAGHSFGVCDRQHCMKWPNIEVPAEKMEEDICSKLKIESHKNADKNELLRNAVTIYRAEHIEPEVFVERLGDDVFYKIREQLVASVLNAEDSAIKKAILQAVDSGKVHTACVIDAEQITKVFDKCIPAPPAEIVLGNYVAGLCGPIIRVVCPCCGREVEEWAHKNFCGQCGKALDWKKFHEDRKEETK